MRRVEHFLAAGALVLATVSTAGFAVLGWLDRTTFAEPEPRVAIEGAAYVATNPGEVAVREAGWNPPPAQSRGRAWVYEVFTPPEIFHDRAENRFVVSAPPAVEKGEPLGVELVAVRQASFRLQLIGFVGREGNWKGTFQNLVTGEVFLAATGHELPALGLRIDRLDVQAQAVSLPESMTTRQRVASAVVLDRKAGREVVLTSRERAADELPRASIIVEGAGDAREVRAGDTFEAGDAAFRIERVQLSPPEVEVVKLKAGDEPRRARVTPRNASAGTSIGGAGE